MAAAALTAPAGRGSVYLDEFQGSKTEPRLAGAVKDIFHFSQ
jgi:hypothetical protein